METQNSIFTMRRWGNYISTYFFTHHMHHTCPQSILFSKQDCRKQFRMHSLIFENRQILQTKALYYEVIFFTATICNNNAAFTLWIYISEPLPGRGPWQGLLILRCESHRPLCVGLVWTFDLFAHVIELRGFFKINVMKSVGKQIEIIKKQ